MKTLQIEQLNSTFNLNSSAQQQVHGGNVAPVADSRLEQRLLWKGYVAGEYAISHKDHLGGFTLFKDPDTKEKVGKILDNP
jgi:hypothetical protein